MGQSNRRYYLSSNDTLSATTKKPLTYVEWLKYEPTFERSTAFEQYTSYLTQWYSKKGITSSSVQQQYVRNIYIELLKQITLEYSTPDEQRFLSNIDYDNDNDLDVAMPFFAKKVKQIALYYASQRDELKTKPLQSNLKGSSFGLNQLIYKQIADVIQNDPDVVTKLNNLNLQVPDVLNNLQIDSVDLYDTEQNYFNRNSKLQPEQTATSGKYNYFDTSLIPDVSKTYIEEQLNQAIVDLIKEIPVIMYSGIEDVTSSDSKELRTVENLSLAISDVITGTELDRLDDSMFVNYTKSGDLNLINQKLLFKNYSGSDFYYLKTGETVTDTTSGKLFSASAPHRNLVNKFYPTIVSVPGTAKFSQEYIGGFYTSTGIGLLSYTSLDYSYEFSQLEPNKTYTFPDPTIGAAGYYGSPEKYDSPIIYYENINWQKKNITTHYNYGQQKQYKNISRFTPYQSKSETTNNNIGVYRHDDTFNFWGPYPGNVWQNSDVYRLIDKKQQISSRAETLGTKPKTLESYKTDIFGNEYVLVKTSTRHIKPPPINNRSTIYDTEYIEPIESEAGVDMNIVERKKHPGEIYIRTIADTGTQTITSAEFSQVLLKYTNQGILKYQSGQVQIQDIYKELHESIIDMDVVRDIIIIETANYIVFEKLVYDYTENKLYSDQKNYAFVRKAWSDKRFEQTSNWWYDEKYSRIVLTKTKLHPHKQKSTSRIIYPEIYVYNINDNVLRQVYPDPDYTIDQVLYETTQYSLSSVNTVDHVEILNVKPPRLTFNKDSETYNVYYIGQDINETISLVRFEFKLYDGIVDDIKNSVFRSKYNTFIMNPGNDEDQGEFFRENNPNMTKSWVQDRDDGLMYLCAKETSGTIQPVSNSSCVWTYGSLPQSYEGTRDIVIGFDFLITGTQSFPDYVANGISVAFFRARVTDQIEPYPGSLAPSYESLDDGGIGPGFSYFDDLTRGVKKYDTLTGLDTGHACVVLNTGHKIGDTNVSPNSIGVYGPYSTTKLYSNIINLNDTKYKLYQNYNEIPNREYKNGKFTRCRITLTDLGKKILVDMKNPGTEQHYTRVVETNISSFFPDDYETPVRLKVAFTANTSRNAGVVVVKNISTIGAGNVTRV